MKKIIQLLFILIIAGSCGKESNPEPYLSAISIYKREYRLGEPGSGKLEKKYEYDREGKLITSDGFGESIWKYKYNSAGQLIEKQSWDQTITYTYNLLDSVAEEKIYDADKLNKRFRYTYDEQRRLIKKEEESFLLTSYYSLYTYEDNTVYEKRFTTKDSDLYWSYSRTYDQYKNLIKETAKSSDGKPYDNYTAIYTYNPDNTIAELITYGALGEKSSKIQTYFYNTDKTIEKIHVVYNYYREEYDLEYKYLYSD